LKEALFEGVVRFRNEDFDEHRELFEQLGDGQSPHTLFIGCSDSRVVPNLITKTLPGELFVVRNIANIVPPYRVSQDFAATTSAIEYAVLVLGVQNIVVCGHSNCSGCSALYLPDASFKEIPNVKKWLELSLPVKKQVLEDLQDKDDALIHWHTEQINIAQQIKHLLTYPFIKERFKDGRLNIFGWYYIIETGEVYSYDFESGLFCLID
jgi:carbonic anhydrase